MSSKPTLTTTQDVDAGLGRRQAALRLAVGVTCCFVFAEAMNWDATFLAPMVAAQFLISIQHSLTLKQVLGIVILTPAAVFGVLAGSVILATQPVSFILCLGLLHFYAFHAQLRGAAELPILMLQIAGVAMPVFVVVSPSLASELATTLVTAGVVAILTVWAAYAVFPTTTEVQEKVTGSAQSAQTPNAIASLALLKTLILMPVLAWFVLHASEKSIFVLIIIITVLRVAEPQLGWRTAFGMSIANLIGGLTASITYIVVKASDSIIFLSVVILFISLVFAGYIVTARKNAPIFYIAFATFILLLGSELSPISGGSEEAALTRVLNVGMATAYAAGVFSLFRCRTVLDKRSGRPQ